MEEMMNKWREHFKQWLENEYKSEVAESKDIANDNYEITTKELEQRASVSSSTKRNPIFRSFSSFH